VYPLLDAEVNATVGKRSDGGGGGDGGGEGGIVQEVPGHPSAHAHIQLVPLNCNESAPGGIQIGGLGTLSNFVCSFDIVSLADSILAIRARNSDKLEPPVKISPLLTFMFP